MGVGFALLDVVTVGAWLALLLTQAQYTALLALVLIPPYNLDAYVSPSLGCIEWIDMLHAMAWASCLA